MLCKCVPRRFDNAVIQLIWHTRVLALQRSLWDGGRVGVYLFCASPLLLYKSVGAGKTKTMDVIAGRKTVGRITGEFDQFDIDVIQLIQWWRQEGPAQA